MNPPSAQQVDARGQRFAAAITAAVLAIALVFDSPVREWLLGWQVAVFVVSAVFGVGVSPYAAIFRTALRPRLGPESDTEDARPPRFAQLVGLVFAASALIAFVFGVPIVGLVLTAFAFVAALLNATVGLCLGCELYLTWRRLGGAQLT